MGFFDTLMEGVSSVVHAVATVANSASSVASAIGAVGAIVAGQQVMGPGDAPIIETLRHNTEMAANVLSQEVQKVLITKADEKDIIVTEVQYTSGIVTKRRILSLEAAKARGQTAANAPVSTGLMYSDMASILSQLGAPPQGYYEDGSTRDNAQYASDQLFLNDVALDPANPSVDTTQVVLNDSNGKPCVKIGHSSYCLQLDQTGMNDISHSCFGYGWDESMSHEERVLQRRMRFKNGGDVIAKTLSGGPDTGTIAGFSVAVKVTVRVLAMASPLATQLQIFAVADSWTVTSCLVSGTIIILNVLIASPPIGVQQDIVDWICNRITGVTVPPNVAPNPLPELEEVVIISSVPAQVPASTLTHRRRPAPKQIQL